MDPERRRIVLFWCGCIPVRILLAHLISITPDTLSPFVSLLSVSISITFLMNIVRAKRGTKKIGGLGGQVWWTRLRFIHALSYGLIAYFLFQMEQETASIIAYVDVCVAIVAGVVHYTLGYDL